MVAEAVAWEWAPGVFFAYTSTNYVLYFSTSYVLCLGLVPVLCLY